MSILMHGLPKPPPEAKHFWGCGTDSPTGTLIGVILVARISQRHCHVTQHTFLCVVPEGVTAALGAVQAGIEQR